MTRTLLCMTAVLLSVVSSAAYAAQDDRIKEVDGCGWVVDSTGSVVSDATVKAMSGEKTIATASTLSDGSFHFEESISSGIVLTAQAKGMAPANETIDRVKAAKGEKKCKRPIYVVLGKTAGSSFITVKKKLVPKSR